MVTNFQKDAEGALIARTPLNRQDLDPSIVHELIVTNRANPDYGEPAPIRFDGIEWRIPADSEDIIP